ncbi:MULTISPECIES: PE-PGRS family protein [Streptomyces]|uniref:PE-PGRS family protein n=1 Tax=Streptomyces venezuelae TaxID=54571 RepID=A0A5P2B1C9_STRVZ|nr:PE-PGRS family protein [Streptomyces venezuelae]QES24096.1 PE-PGRS family protein [Streptomyces venezuelae]
MGSGRGRTRAELVDLLDRAGLELVGEWGPENVLTPMAAWRPVISYETVPTATVRDDRPDLVPALNAQWHRLAGEHGIIDDKGEFLVHVGGGDPWARVRLAPAWDLAGVLGDRPGRPEFVTLSVDGDALLGVTGEEYEVWLVAVTGVRERLEEAARAAARETPEEREAAWEGLRAARLRPTRRLWGTWVEWLGFNDAASDEVLIRLLDLGAVSPLHRTSSATVLDAAATHPDPQIRAALAERRRPMAPEQWTVLVLGEQSPARRALLVEIAAARGGLTEAGHERIATDPSPLVRAEAARTPGLPSHLLTTLAADPDPSVRAAAAGDARQRSGATDRAAHEALAAHQDPHTRRTLAADPHAHPEALALLAADENVDVRRTLAAHPGLPAETLAALLADENEPVRRAASVHPVLSEEQRAACLPGLDLDGMRHDVPWVRDLHGDPEAMRRLAASCHPLLRGTVARARHLPPDVVERLARDEDRVVRLFLAESCDDAPADMLLEVWQWWNGSFSSPGRPRTHPNFPRAGLLPYATDPHPRLRQLALDDPESTPELVERFSRDEDGEVRLRAATDPRLSAASAVRLLDDGSAAVRHAAARHPALPARALVRALRDREFVRDAVMNPALPDSVMHWMIDTAVAGLEEQRP